MQSWRKKLKIDKIIGYFLKPNYMKHLGTLVKTSFILGFTISFVAILVKVLHYPGSNTLLAIGILFIIAFIFSAILEIHDSKKLDGREKFMWTIGLITMATLIGTIYVFSARKRIIVD